VEGCSRKLNLSIRRECLTETKSLRDESRPDMYDEARCQTQTRSELRTPLETMALRTEFHLRKVFALDAVLSSP